MAGKKLLSFKRPAWVIPNGCGQLWTDRIFDTEADAKLYVAQQWEAMGLTGSKHRPVLAEVRLTASPLPTRSNTGGHREGPAR